MKKRNVKKTPKAPLLATYEKVEPMSQSDVSCPVCMSIFIDPVTFKCKHSVCYKCLESMIEKSNLNCPCCRDRLAYFCRTNKMDKAKVINHVFKTRLEQEYSQAIAIRLEELKMEEDGENMSWSRATFLPDDSGFFNDENGSTSSHVLDGTISKPGEIAKEFDAIYSGPKKALEREKQAEEEASQAVIDKLREEEGHAELERQLENDFILAKAIEDEERSSVEILNESTIINQDSQRQTVFTVTPASQSKRQNFVQSSKTTKKKNTNSSMGSARLSNKNPRKRPSSSSIKSNKRNCTRPNSSISSTPVNISNNKEDRAQLKLDNFVVRSPSASSTTSTISSSSLDRIRRSSPPPPTPISPSDSGYSLTPASFNSTTTTTTPSSSIFCQDNEQPGPSRVYIPEIITTTTSSHLQSFKFSQLRVDSDSDDECHSPSLLANCSPSNLINNSPGPSSSQKSTLSSLLQYSEGSSEPSSPVYPVDYYIKEDEEIQEHLRRLKQEEEDRKFALQLSKQLAQGLEYRGKESKEKYSIREWCKKGQKN